MDDILHRLEVANEYCESSESRQLRKDAAEEIRRMRSKLAELQDAVDILGRRKHDRQ